LREAQEGDLPPRDPLRLEALHRREDAREGSVEMRLVPRDVSEKALRVAAASIGGAALTLVASRGSRKV
jgi:hypothetical protein